MSKSKRTVAPFTNEWGHTINPGDSVFAITVCTKVTSVSKAEYVGYIERNAYDYSVSKYTPQKFAQIKFPVTNRHAVYKGTTTPIVWSTFDRAVDSIEWIETQGFRISTLQYNRILPDTVSAAQLAEVV